MPCRQYMDYYSIVRICLLVNDNDQDIESMLFFYNPCVFSKIEIFYCNDYLQLTFHLLVSSGPSQSRKSGGLSSLLGQLNRKNKLSTLEKSKLDWTTYKQDEGIEEEIQSHNKGKTG